MKEIPLTQGKVALVDDEDYERLNAFNWFAHKKSGRLFYAARQIRLPNGKQRQIYLHNEVLSVPPDLRVDHKSCDGLDNRKENLRLSTNPQNQWNQRKTLSATSSRYKGVSWRKDGLQWHTQIRFHGHRMHLGYFDFESDAARAYDAKSRELFGEHARPNFPSTT